jgi:hypothetical protein
MRWTGYDTLFREPDGPRTGAIYVALAVLCFGLYGYFLVGYSQDSLLFLALGSINAFVALPEFLPRERTRLAGGLRAFNVVVGILVLTAVILQY